MDASSALPSARIIARALLSVAGSPSFLREATCTESNVRVSDDASNLTTEGARIFVIYSI
jgi:hypothetical protein